MHPAQINAITLLLNNLVQQAQAQMQICQSLKQIMQQGARPPIQQPQMPMQEPGYLSPQEEAVLGYGIQQAQQQASIADQNPNFNPQMHDAFEAAAAGMLPHHPANRRQAPQRQPQQQQMRPQAPVSNGLGGGLAGFDPMMGLGDIMGGF
jgi:hypothetical protein